MKRKALFVGVNEYKDPAIQDLRFAVGDAAMLFAQFKAIGFEAELMANPTRTAVEEKVASMIEGMEGADDVFLFYFAGHGFVAPGDDERLFCKDDMYKKLQYHSAGLSFAMLRDLTQIGELNRIFILDSCRSNVFAGQRGKERPRDLVPMAKMMKMAHGGGAHAIWRSCCSGQSAMELEKYDHGLFSMAIDRVMTDFRERRSELAFNRPFLEKVCASMAVLARDNHLAAAQTPEDSYSGNWPCIVLLKGMKQPIPKEEPQDPLPALPKTGDVKTLVLPGGTEMEMVYCVPGEFLMGSPDSEEGRSPNEKRHRVRLTRGFWLGKFPVTQEQWQGVMGSNPSSFCGNMRLPVDSVSWNMCRAFVERVAESARRQFGGEARFPTEAEWEYACRAGTTTAYSWGSSLYGDKANCDGTGPYGTTMKGTDLGKTTPAGCYDANAWGFFDMHGNVWEWCADWYGDYGGDAVDPVGPPRGRYRVLRGGCWNQYARNCRAAIRNWFKPDFKNPYCGFRLACTAKEG